MSSDQADRNFVMQQGLPDPGPSACQPITSALLYQPRLIGLVLLPGLYFQKAAPFVVLAILLWWSAAMPRLNPFEALYHLRHPDQAPVPTARPPRRFAQAVAALFASMIAVGIVQAWWRIVYGLEAFFSLAVAALAFTRLCFGSFLYYLARGQVRFAVQTLPWGRGV